MKMKVPFRVRKNIGRGLMYAHGVRKLNPKEIVIPERKPSDQIRQGFALIFREIQQ
jgi:hypothetical protein